MYSWILTSFLAMASKITYVNYNTYYDSEFNILLYIIPCFLYLLINIFYDSYFFIDYNGILYCLFFSVNKLFILINDFRINNYYFGIITTSEIIFSTIIPYLFLKNLFNYQLIFSMITISGGSFACCYNEFSYNLLQNNDVENQNCIVEYYKNNNSILINVLSSASAILENIFLAKYLYNNNNNNNIIILLFYNYLISGILIILFNRIVTDKSNNYLIEFKSYENYMNYIFFLFKFYLNHCMYCFYVNHFMKLQI